MSTHPTQPHQDPTNHRNILVRQLQHLTCTTPQPSPPHYTVQKPYLPSIAAHTTPLATPPTHGTETRDHGPGASPEAVTDAEVKAAMQVADQTVKKHIQALHEYNEVKDVALGLCGVLAEKRGVRVSDVLRDLGVEEGE